MVKYTNLSPRDIETLAEKAKTKVKDPSLNVVIDGDKIIKNSIESKSDRLIIIGNNRRKKSFQKTMSHVRDELSTTERLLSYLIHNNFIENISDLLGKSILRPNPIIFGALSALIITIINYVLNRHYNYQLSGFESIIAFVFGWTFGIIYDYLKILVTGKK